MPDEDNSDAVNLISLREIEENDGRRIADGCIMAGKFEAAVLAIHLKDGEWKLKISAKGYNSKKAKVGISGEGTREQNIELKPKRWN